MDAPAYDNPPHPIAAATAEDGESMAERARTAAALPETRLRCRPFGEWVSTSFRAPSPTATEDVAAAMTTAAPSTALVARLMGSPRRRASALRFRVTNVTAVREAVRSAFLSAGGAPTSMRFKP